MAKKVCIAYGTRYGNTEEISEKIAEILKQKGIESQLFNLKKVKSKNWPSIDDFDGIIVGSSLIATKWKKETKTFLKNNKEGINKGNIKLGVFVVGMFTLVDYNKQKEDNIKTGIIEEMGVNVTLYDAFGPVVDFSPDAKIGKTTKLIMKAAGKGIENDTDIKIDFEGYNDLRDWDKIKEFAENFGDLVLK